MGNGCVGDRFAAEFWSHARKVLDGLDLSDSDLRKTLASIERELPEPRRTTRSVDV